MRLTVYRSDMGYSWIFVIRGGKLIPISYYKGIRARNRFSLGNYSYYTYEVDATNDEGLKLLRIETSYLRHLGAYIGVVKRDGISWSPIGLDYLVRFLPYPWRIISKDLIGIGDESRIVRDFTAYFFSPKRDMILLNKFTGLLFEDWVYRAIALAFPEKVMRRRRMIMVNEFDFKDLLGKSAYGAPDIILDINSNSVAVEAKISFSRGNLIQLKKYAMMNFDKIILVTLHSINPTLKQQLIKDEVDVIDSVIRELSLIQTMEKIKNALSNLHISVTALARSEN